MGESLGWGWDRYEFGYGVRGAQLGGRTRRERGRKREAYKIGAKEETSVPSSDAMTRNFGGQQAAGWCPLRVCPARR